MSDLVKSKAIQGSSIIRPQRGKSKYFKDLNPHIFMLEMVRNHLK